MKFFEAVPGELFSPLASPNRALYADADRKTGGAEAYTYLGTANYVKHTGSRPMNITWQLDRPIPAKFLKKTNKLVVG